MTFFLRLDILRPEEEKQPHIHPTRHPSRGHAHVRMVRSEIHPWWPQHLLWFPQHLRPHSYVHLLHAQRLRPRHTKVLMVEKIPDDIANGNFRFPNSPDDRELLTRDFTRPHCTH